MQPSADCTASEVQQESPSLRYPILTVDDHIISAVFDSINMRAPIWTHYDNKDDALADEAYDMVDSAILTSDDEPRRDGTESFAHLDDQAQDDLSSNAGTEMSSSDAHSSQPPTYTPEDREEENKATALCLDDSVFEHSTLVPSTRVPSLSSSAESLPWKIPTMQITWLGISANGTLVPWGTAVVLIGLLCMVPIAIISRVYQTATQNISIPAAAVVSAVTLSPSITPTMTSHSHVPSYTSPITPVEVKPRKVLPTTTSETGNTAINTPSPQALTKEASEDPDFSLLEINGHVYIQMSQRLSRKWQPPQVFVEASRANKPLNASISKLNATTFALDLGPGHMSRPIDITVWTKKNPTVRYPFKLPGTAPWLDFYGVERQMNALKSALASVHLPDWRSALKKSLNMTAGSIDTGITSLQKFGIKVRKSSSSSAEWIQKCTTYTRRVMSAEAQGSWKLVSKQASTCYVSISRTMRHSQDSVLGELSRVTSDLERVSHELSKQLRLMRKAVAREASAARKRLPKMDFSRLPSAESLPSLTSKSIRKARDRALKLSRKFWKKQQKQQKREAKVTKHERRASYKRSKGRKGKA